MMETDRTLRRGDRVRIIGRDAVMGMEDGGYGRRFPESGGHSLRFADPMLQYCGRECVVERIIDGYPHRYILRLCDDDKVMEWVWCPSMLEDPEPDPEPVETAALFGWLLEA